MVVLFKVTNALITFMNYMNHIFRPYLNKFLLADILICLYSLDNKDNSEPSQCRNCTAMETSHLVG